MIPDISKEEEIAKKNRWYLVEARFDKRRNNKNATRIRKSNKKNFLGYDYISDE